MRKLLTIVTAASLSLGGLVGCQNRGDHWNDRNSSNGAYGTGGSNGRTSDQMRSGNTSGSGTYDQGTGTYGGTGSTGGTGGGAYGGTGTGGTSGGTGGGA